MSLQNGGKSENKGVLFYHIYNISCIQYFLGSSETVREADTYRDDAQLKYSNGLDDTYRDDMHIKMQTLSLTICSHSRSRFLFLQI